MLWGENRDFIQFSKLLQTSMAGSHVPHYNFGE